MVAKSITTKPPENMKVLNALLITATLTTLVIFPQAINAFDLIKLIVLSLSTTVVLFWTIFYRKKHSLRIDNSLKLFSILFIIGLLVNIAIGSMPKSHAIVGLFGRNNGALTYLCLLIILVLASTIHHPKVAKIFLFTISRLGALLSIYGLIQDSGFDFIDYGDTKFPNPIFLTLGNTNFTSALIGMSLMATISILFFRKKDNSNKIMSKILTYMSAVLQSLILYRAEATQGFIAFGAGAAIFLFFLPSESNENNFQKILLQGRRAFGILALIIAGLGVVGIGPLSILFASGARSLQDRFYHWVTGYSMFKDNLLFGVGLDSYGQWYRAYRTPESIELLGTAKGFANDAHNVYVQIAATGGIALLVPFLLINVLILMKVIRHIHTKEYSREFLGLFSIWIVFQAQMLVSINQSAIAVWGWVSGGLLINCLNWDSKSLSSISRSKSRESVKSSIENRWRVNLSFLISCLLSVAVFLGSILLAIPNQVREIQIKNQIIELDRALSDSSPDAQENSQVASQKLLELGLRSANPALRYACIQQLLIGGYTEESLEIAKLTAQQFPREFDAWDAIGFIYENTGREKLAIEARRMQLYLDPLNPDLRERLRSQK